MFKVSLKVTARSIVDGEVKVNSNVQIRAKVMGYGNVEVKVKANLQLMSVDRFKGKVNGHARVVARLKNFSGRFKVHGQQEGNV